MTKTDRCLYRFDCTRAVPRIICKFRHWLSIDAVYRPMLHFLCQVRSALESAISVVYPRISWWRIRCILGFRYQIRCCRLMFSSMPRKKKLSLHRSRGKNHNLIILQSHRFLRCEVDRNKAVCNLIPIDPPHFSFGIVLPCRIAVAINAKNNFAMDIVSY